MLTQTGRCISVLVTETDGGVENVIGRFDFPVYSAPRRLLGVDVPGTRRSVLGYPAGVMSVDLPEQVQAIVEAEHQRGIARHELFTLEWVTNSLVPGIRRTGYGAHGPFEVALAMRDTYCSREPLADGLRRIGNPPPLTEGPSLG